MHVHTFIYLYIYINRSQRSRRRQLKKLLGLTSGRTDFRTATSGRSFWSSFFRFFARLPFYCKSKCNKLDDDDDAKEGQSRVPFFDAQISTIKNGRPFDHTIRRYIVSMHVKFQCQLKKRVSRCRLFNGLFFTKPRPQPSSLLPWFISISHVKKETSQVLASLHFEHTAAAGPSLSVARPCVLSKPSWVDK